MRRLKFRCEEVADSVDWDGTPFKKVTLRGIEAASDMPQAPSSPGSNLFSFRIPKDGSYSWQVGAPYYAEFKSAEEVAEGR